MSCPSFADRSEQITADRKTKNRSAESHFEQTTKAIDAKYDAKEPEHDRPTTTFFTTPDGTLMRNDPSQPRLPLREVDTEPANEPVRVGE